MLNCAILAPCNWLFKASARRSQQYKKSISRNELREPVGVNIRGQPTAYYTRTFLYYESLGRIVDQYQFWLTSSQHVGHFWFRFVLLRYNVRGYEDYSQPLLIGWWIHRTKYYSMIEQPVGGRILKVIFIAWWWEEFCRHYNSNAIVVGCLFHFLWNWKSLH